MTRVAVKTRYPMRSFVRIFMELFRRGDAA
jgi:hypothetical protein